MAKVKFDTAVVLGDLHGNKIDKEAFDCALQVIKEISPDILFLNGDIGDYESVSLWLDKKKLKQEGLRIRDDIDAAKYLLKKLSSVVKKKCKKIVGLGNHDGWVREYVERNPEVEKDFDLMKEYAIDGFHVLAENYKYQLGKLTIFHNLPKVAGDFHSKANLTRMGCNCLYNHYHDYQSYSYQQYSGKHSSTCNGCLCRMDMDYLEGNPNRWSHGFHVVYSHRGTGYFTKYFVEIINGNTVWNGKFYSGRKNAK